MCADDGDQDAKSVSYGLSWGFTRTYWSADKNDEGYAAAGTGATRLGFRRIQPADESWELVPHLDYLWMRSTITTLICDTCYGEVRTDRSYFRELDLGLDLHFFPFHECDDFYVGTGPLVRWGSSGTRMDQGRRNERSTRAAWFGLNMMIGYRAFHGENLGAFIEPVLTWSPDDADRWQHVFPPDNLSLQMGLMWK